ncbi:MAG: hypothetical protein ABIG95_04420 [Candidatus Woesearchaeota archaeon]
MDEKRIYINPGGAPPNCFTIVYKDVFHLKSLYVVAREWLQEQGWESCLGNWEYQKGSGNWEQLLYDNRSAGNKKIWIWWRLQKRTGNNYYRYYMNINFMLLGWQDVEALHNGKKYKAQVGELSIFIKPWIQYDFDDKWDNHPILKHIHPFFIQRIFKEDMLKREKLLLDESYRLQGTIKKFLEGKHFGPDEAILYEPRHEFA